MESGNMDKLLKKLLDEYPIPWDFDISLNGTTIYAKDSTPVARLKHNNHEALAELIVNTMNEKFNGKISEKSS